MNKLALALAIGLLGSSAMAPLAIAQDKPVDLKISIWLPPAHPLVPATKEWATSSKGRRYDGPRSPRAARQGLRPRDMARRHCRPAVNPGYQPGAFR
jgi:hypothetical protein